jgi:hypothetical protein
MEDDEAFDSNYSAHSRGGADTKAARPADLNHDKLVFG